MILKKDDNKLLKPNLAKISIIMSFIVGITGTLASFLGIFNRNIYGDLRQINQISETILNGSVAQDYIILLVSLILIMLCILSIKKIDLSKLILILGLVWCEFYAFGLYVIQGQYTNIYYLYMIIFGVSFYAIIIGIYSLQFSNFDKLQYNNKVLKNVSYFLILVVLLLTPIWILKMIPGLQENIPSETYAVFILDLCIVFPAILTTAIMNLRKIKLGIVLSGICLTKALALCLTWGFAEVYVPLVMKKSISLEMILTSGLFSLISLVLIVPYFIELNKATKNNYN